MRIIILKFLHPCSADLALEVKYWATQDVVWVIDWKWNRNSWIKTKPFFITSNRPCYFHSVQLHVDEQDETPCIATKKHNVPLMKFQIRVRRPFESSGYDEFPIKTSDLSGQIAPVKPTEPRHKSLIDGLKYSAGF